ncbi:DoxX family protein [Rhodovastum atsumiense]|uniref:DoxX family protein n=1 Tax=Rhodovastum atsumiense TaxID=504468 RepID=A0A5M6ISZ6_9PROT|nr:DoxX family protein [Rhodovastum atsumiense]KAA5611443.1 DoxX family protein [Rhodovastum atsumiense]CAH2601126.1 DoxX family protein [Rhodovastum atsumiense]
MTAAGTVLHRLCLIGLCAAYLQGGVAKLGDLPAALNEMAQLGLQPVALFATAVIVLELGASAMVILGIGRRAGALALAAFTLAASLIALRFWDMPPGPQRFAATNGFFEHLGLVGGLLLVALQARREGT